MKTCCARCAAPPRGKAPTPDASRDDGDETILALARLFREHPAWGRAARRIREGAASNVYFSHKPGERWRLVREGGVSRLERGSSDDPDFVFRFTPASVERLAATRGEVSDFAVTLFSLMIDPDDSRRVGFRVVAPFSRLTRRGYLRLLVEAGRKVWDFASAHGISDLARVAQLARQLRQRGPFEWES